MCGRADQLPLSSYGKDKLINLMVGVYIPDSCHLQVRWPIPQYKELFEKPQLAHLLLPFLRLCWIRFLTSSVVPVMFLIHTSCHAVPCASIMVALAQSLLAHVPNDHKCSWVKYIRTSAIGEIISLYTGGGYVFQVFSIHCHPLPRKMILFSQMPGEKRKLDSYAF